MLYTSELIKELFIYFKILKIYFINKNFQILRVFLTVDPKQIPTLPIVRNDPIYND